MPTMSLEDFAGSNQQSPPVDTASQDTEATSSSKPQSMSLDEFTGVESTPNKPSFTEALQNTRQNSLNSLERVWQGVKDFATEKSAPTTPGRKMTPEEFDVYKKLGYTSNTKSALEGLMANSVDDLMPAWNDMSSTPSAQTLAAEASKVSANPDLYKDKPGIMDYLAGKIDSEGFKDFTSHLENPNKLILEGSLPSNFIQGVLNSKDQERFRFDQVQSILNAQKILSTPDRYSPDQVKAAKATIQDFNEKTGESQESTIDKLRKMRDQIVQHPAEAAAGLVNSLVADPELLAIPGAGVTRANSIATRVGTGALEGAALNTVISVAQQGKDISGKVDDAELGTAALLGLGLGGTISILRRGEKAYKANLDDAKLNGTYEQILKERAAHDAVVEDAVKGNTKVPDEVQQRINDMLGIKSQADREKFLKQRKADVKAAFKTDAEYADYLKYVDEEKTTRHQIYMDDLKKQAAERDAGLTEAQKYQKVSDDMWRTALETGDQKLWEQANKLQEDLKSPNATIRNEAIQAAKESESLRAAHQELRSRRQKEFEKATAARDEALRAKDHEAALAENDRLDSLRSEAEREALEDAYGQNHPVVKRAMLAADRSDRASRLPPWQRGNIDPELLQKMGLRAGLITAGSVAGSFLFPDNKKAGAILGGAAGLLLPAGGAGVRFRRGQSGAIGGLGARTAKFDHLKAADSMLKEGKTREEIYDSTGWYQGVDGKWKFEIPDDAATINPDAIRAAKQGKPVTLGDALKHDKLFEAYPELANIKLRVKPLAQHHKGSFLNDTLTINSDPMAYAGKGVVGGIKSTILHEIQHSIQNKEGFAKGASVTTVGKKFADQRKQASDDLRELNQQYRQGDPGYQKVQQKLKEINELDQKIYKEYRKHAGEVEARNVQGRLVNNERRPFESEDIPASDQIVNFKNGRSSSEELPQNNKLVNEKELIDKAKEGNQVAFTKLYNHFAPQLKRFAASYARDAGPKLGVDAGELAHIALAKGLMHLDQFSGDSSLSTWLHSIVKNEGLQLIRSGQSRIDTTSMFVHKADHGAGSLKDGHILDEGNSSGLRAGVEERMASNETPEAIESARETEQMLNHAFRKVPENTRQAIKMFFLDGMSQEDIAKAMGIPQQTVSTLVFRGKKVLQDTLEKELGTGRGTGKYTGMGKRQAGSMSPELMKKLAVAGVGAGIGSWLNKKHPIWGAIIGAGASLALSRGKTVFDDLDKTIMPMSTRIKNKSETVHFRLKEYYRVRNTVTHDLIEAGAPFLEALNKIPKAAQSLLERSILTGDRSITDKLIDAIGNPALKGGWTAMRTVLDGLGARLLDMKMIKEQKPDYFPRIVKDKEGLFAAIGKDVSEPLQAALDNANRESIKKTGNALTEAEQSDLINKYLNKNYKGKMSQRPGFSFSRRFEEIPEELQPFYANLAESYHSYIRSAVKNIEQAKFFGKNLVSKEEGGITYPDLDKSIGEYVNAEIKAGKMSSDDVKEISDQIRAMFGNFERGGNATLKAGKDLTMAGFLGNPLSAAAQVTTPIVTTYLQGLRPTLEAVVRKISGKQIVSARSFGLADHMSEEFVGTTRAAKFLRGALKWGAFKFSDLLDKDIKLNSAVIKARQLVKTEKGRAKLAEKYKAGFGDRYDSLIKELQENKLGDDTRALAYGELSRSDPIDPVEFSEFYANNPNGRTLMALKSYMLKQMDLIRRDAYNEIKKGNRAKGIKNLAAIGIVLGLSGMATKDLQNFMLGRPIKHHPSDLFVNMLKTFGWSEYASRKAFGETKPTRKNPTGASKAKGELFQTVGEAIAPPIPYEAMDAIWNRDPKAVAMIPVVGRFLAEYYKNKNKTPAQRKKEAQEL